MQISKAVQLRHKVVDAALVERLQISMSQTGWTERRLLVVQKGQDCYENITGTHRSAAAMALGIPIPAIIIEESDLTPELRQAIDGGVEARLLDAIFEKTGLIEAADLIREERKYGGTAAEVKPPNKPMTGRGRVKFKRVE